MANTLDFLTQVLPTEGFYFTSTPGDKGWFNRAHTTLDDAVAHVNALTFEGKPAYFALGTFEQARYYDAAAERFRSRTQGNVKFLRSFFLDLDVDPADPKKFASKRDAIDELKAFAKKVGLPKPMLVDSGGGVHAYWPLALAVPASEWRPVADQFKAICLSERFKVDMSVPADQARVLRAPGSYNTKREAPVQVLWTAPPVSFIQFADAVRDYAGAHGVAAPSRPSGVSGLSGKAPAGNWTGEDNLGTTNEPVNFDHVVFACAQLQEQRASRGLATGEQLWRAGLGVVKFSLEQEKAARSISDAHPNFSMPATLVKLNNWSTGPTTCEHFHQLNPSVCEACPHWQKLTTPVQLGRHVREAPAPQIIVENRDSSGTAPVVITLPDPPTGYSRREGDGAVVMKSEDRDGKPVQEVVCEYDLYPITIRSQSGADATIDERSLWRMHIPMVKGQPMQTRDIDVPLGMLADTKALSKLLMSKGLLLKGDQPKLVNHYMTAYLQKLAREAGREKLYERLGWHDGHDAFVLGDRVLYADGTSKAHVASDAIRNVTKGGLTTKGTLDGWRQAMEFYNRPGYEGHRFMIYCALGAPLFHMNDTGNKGVLIAASGASGRGKTTCFKACSSLWGNTDALIVNGNQQGSTINALYHALGTLHSVPMLWDDTTERDPEEMRRFALNISQGEGKRRMNADGTLTGRHDTWMTPVLTTTNADTLHSLMGSGRDVDPHLMRLIAVEFGLIDTSVTAKIAADNFIRAIGANHGHAGGIFMQQIVQYHEKIRTGFIRNVEMIDQRLASANASAERYWSGTLGTAYTGAQIGHVLGLHNYPFKQDLEWMIGLLTRQRQTIREAMDSPMELLVNFLNSYNRNTLVISARSSTNLDNVVNKPFDDLLVRRELDTNLIYVARHAIMEYCTTSGSAFRPLENALEQQGIVVQRNAQKVLGADTIFRTGQTRCWKIDATKLAGYIAPPQAAASNVVPINQGARTA